MRAGGSIRIIRTFLVLTEYSNIQGRELGIWTKNGFLAFGQRCRYGPKGRYVFSAPGKLLNSLPGTLMLTDCLEACQTNEACRAVNYETGLCVLFSANADKLPGALTKSQFPVFTIYAQKSCLGIRPCLRAWCVDRVQGYKLNGYAKRTIPVVSRRDCLELCLGENEFTC
ncbi:PREDICTED: uncharacterized protein LOC108382197, partial [Rhagoletis zephyria]|uniref:uncharacterized protein LOC108382197 n=1 Tax=Rhagoletis zephyria TaxID=28612 RepID=UPI0008114868